MNRQPTHPWYKEFWPWMILAVLASSIIAGTTFLVLSITSYDGMVEDNYYKTGLAINQVIAQDHRATELGMAAAVRLDDLTGDINVELSGEARPERLLLTLIFPTRDDRDQQLILERVRGSHYVGQAPRQLEHRWYLQLAPDAQAPDWRLRGEATFPSEDAFRLTAQAKDETP
ncbi:FixH family protein [Halomonas sp. YLGW01]|uniref:FixH family protein n=1 Tax=Halomonas sp. YLGW01 TaxID=2773308 RepID=UPI001F5B031F|nr:FixH family protein [Halomonas sp. YLGW01]